MSTKTLQFGLLLLPSYQWLDAAGPVDYINCHTQWYLSFLGLDEATVAKGANIKWHYISSDLKPVHPTSGPAETPTCTYTDCPELDYLIVPGPDPLLALPEGCAKFLQDLIVKESFKALLVVCSGSFAIAQSGILDDLQVCGAKAGLKILVKVGALNKNVKWVGDRRWTVDGKVWSAGGITAGIDLAAEFSKRHFDPEIVAIVQEGAEYEPNPAQPDPFARILDGVSLS